MADWITILHRIRLRVRSVLLRDLVEREMDAEMRHHLDRATERLMGRGIPRREARAMARREFGNVGVLKEQSRDARGGRWIHETASDIRYGVRGLIRTPLFTVVALTSLVLGIGLNTALFTMVEAAFTPSTAVDPSTLVDVRVRWSYPAFSYVRGRPLQSDDVSTANGSGISGGEWVPVSIVALATLAVLLIACANVTNLMLARSASRRREIAVRQCLGASRARLVRQLLTESGVLAVIGGIGGVVVVTVVLRLVAISGVLAPIASGDSETMARALAPDVSVLACALAISLITAAVIGFVPALRATDNALMGAVKSDSGAFGQRLSRSRLRSGLVVAQVSLSLVLLVSAGLLLRSSTRALSVDVGFDRRRVLVVSLDLELAGYDSAATVRFDRSLRAAVSTVPGVQSVTRGGVPLTQRNRAMFTPAVAGGGSGAASTGYIAFAEPGYFEAMGIPIERGRTFTEEELRTGAQVAVITESTARSLWPNESPLGRSLAISATGKLAGAIPGATISGARIVGVARDAQMVELGAVPAVFAFLPGGGDLFVRTVGDPNAVQRAVHDLVRSMDPRVIAQAVPLADVIANEDDAVLGARRAAGFALAVGLLALALAATGLFGVVAYAVSQRTRELGIRIALGARPSEVRGLVVGQGMRLVAVGGLVGIVGGAAASRVLGALLFGMSPLDPSAYAGAGALLAVVAVLACYVPARRATRVDPLVALRQE